MGNAAPKTEVAEESFDKHELQSGVFAVGARREAEQLDEEEAFALSFADALSDILVDEHG